MSKRNNENLREKRCKTFDKLLGALQLCFILFVVALIVHLFIIQIVDLRKYRKRIVDTINATVPGKNPRVFAKYYSTDVLTHSESVAIGRALAKIDELKTFGKTVTIF